MPAGEPPSGGGEGGQQLRLQLIATLRSRTSTNADEASNPELARPPGPARKN